MKVESLFYESMGNGDFEKLPENEQISFLERHAFGYNYEIRLTVAERLGIIKPREEALSILKRMIWDKDELVAADYLCVPTVLHPTGTLTKQCGASNRPMLDSIPSGHQENKRPGCPFLADSLGLPFFPSFLLPIVIFCINNNPNNLLCQWFLGRFNSLFTNAKCKCNKNAENAFVFKNPNPYSLLK